MEERYGPTHGAYIWGRSVHNIRIERLWCDVTRGFGRKWSQFFYSLEIHYGLNTNLDAHIWLLHHLFLPAVNADAQEWSESWNHHKIRLADRCTTSPRDMFFFGMIENGLRGFDDLGAPDAEDDVENLEEYGVDWEELHNQDTLAHHNENNPDEDQTAEALQNPFSNDGPHRLSHVEVSEPPCPLSEEDLVQLNTYLETHPHMNSRSMNSRRVLWKDALSFVRNLYQ
ncbi:hypothetical protein C8F01DRAFT_978820 [Mycena amicta]|nr:hypothetical protein C8F01DRAFT_978820 [Mycena amicta]